MSDHTTADGQQPTHYETLGVSPGASSRAIERAWRRRTAKEGPGSDRLAQLNDAAGVLLDSARRAAYDEQLASARPKPQPVASRTDAGADAAAPTPRASGVRRLAVVLLPILTLGAVALAVTFTVQDRQRTATDRAATEAQAVAERALKPVLSYDYRRLDADRDRATAMLAPKLRKEFDKTYDELLAEGKGGTPGAAVQTKTVVTAETVGTAVMDASPDKVTILAFVNQTSTHDEKQPRTFANRVRVVLVEQDGTWLISELDPR